MAEALLHLADGFEEIEAVAVLDILRRAGIDTLTVSLNGEKIVKSTRNMKIESDILYEEADYEKADIIILPGGMPGSENIAKHKGINEKIKEYHKNGKKLAAICAAPMVFGMLGILEGEKAVCYPGVEQKLKGAEITFNRVEVSNNIITSRGAGTAVYFALKIVEIFKGKELSDKIKKAMLIED